MRKAHGPALTLRVPFTDPTDPDLREITVDLTPQLPLGEAGIKFPTWIGWPRPGARWPSQEKIRVIQNIGINATAKKPYDWMRCFAAAEKELMNGIDADGGCRKKCHRIMKRVREQFWCKTTKPGVSSFMLKVRYIPDVGA